MPLDEAFAALREERDELRDALERPTHWPKVQGDLLKRINKAV